GDVRGVGRTAQQAIEFVEFAAFALPAHPALFALTPHAAPVQQQEAFAAGGQAVTPVEARDADDGDVEQRIVLGRVLRGRVHPVRQQREVQLLVGGGEVVDLQPVYVFFDRRAGIQQYRHGHQRAQVLRNAIAQLQARQ